MSIVDLSSLVTVVIRVVNAANLEFEFGLIRLLIEHFPFVSLVTITGGVILNPGAGIRRHDFLYGHLKRTVEANKTVQLGLALTDAYGKLPTLGTQNIFVWGFNFSDFDPSRDRHSVQWIETLTQKGIDLQKNRECGIDSKEFAEKMMSSGLVCNEEVTWVTFRGAHDFGNLLKMMTGKALPDHLPEFLELVKTYFGANFNDIKHLMKYGVGLRGGLEQVAKTLKVEPPTGKVHHAGEYSLLTWRIFQKMMKSLTCVEPEKLTGIIHGLES